LDAPLDRGDHVAGFSRAFVVQDSQRYQMSTRRHAAEIPGIRRWSRNRSAGDDAGHMGAMTVRVLGQIGTAACRVDEIKTGANGARGKILMREDSGIDDGDPYPMS